MMKFLFYSCFLLLAFSCFPRKIQALEIQFNTLNISHQLSVTLTCNRTSKAGLTNKLEVVKRQSPCSADQWDSKQVLNISLADILVRDQLRVNSIHARTNKQAKLPAQSGHPLDNGNYIVNIGFGTPVRRLSLIFDTGSDVTWIQCIPCLKYCYRQKEPIFNSSASTTYSKIHCKSRECSELDKYQGGSDCYHNSTCVYSVEYGDGSYTIGFYSSDTLTLTVSPTHDDVFPSFLFGCGQNNTGIFGEIAGLLGLGRTPISFVSQTAKKFHKHFSYCLPSSESSTGFLELGKHNENKNEAKMVFTPLVPVPPGGYPLYYIEITSISVGGTRLPINESVFTTAGAMIDSGTMITNLPPSAYKVLSEEFKRLMTKVFKYKMARAFSILDTCFHFSNITKVPTVSFTFEGNSTIHLDPSGILYVVESTWACLAFVGNTDPKDVAIFGNTQQMKFEVMYDVAGNRLGFRNNPSCL